MQATASKLANTTSFVKVGTTSEEGAGVLEQEHPQGLGPKVANFSVATKADNAEVPVF
jgi:hypothetical protein